MKRPKLNSNQYLVGHADYATGHVLKNDLAPYGDECDTFLIFDSKQEAMNYIERIIKENPDVECWMEDSLGKHVITMDKHGERKYNKS